MVGERLRIWGSRLSAGNVSASAGCNCLEIEVMAVILRNRREFPAGKLMDELPVSLARECGTEWVRKDLG